MSEYYNPQRVKNLYQPGAEKPFRISRSKIDLFIACCRCFYLDRRLGIGRPPGYPFSLNSAVDALLKKEFDLHRTNGTKHWLCDENGLDVVPFQHELIDEWRDSLHKGITYVDPTTNLLITGGVDDVWVRPNGELIIVDYKATSKNGEVSLDADWQDGYRRQMEVYQWLFRKNGFQVSDTGYFVYCNGKTDPDRFDGKLEFDIKLLPYTGNADWIEPTLIKAKACLDANELPESSSDCDFCAYFDQRINKTMPATVN